MKEPRTVPATEFYQGDLISPLEEKWDSAP
jgi:hypothetical protein